MPKDFPRSRRIAEQIQRELSDIIRLELKDPRVGMVTITDVEQLAGAMTEQLASLFDTDPRARARVMGIRKVAAR